MIFQTDIYLDTHAVVWLYTNELHKFSKNTLKILESSNLLISPMVKLELEYLYQKGRINGGAEQVVSTHAPAKGATATVAVAVFIKVSDGLFASLVLINVFILSYFV